ncbi:MAG TPA: FemAB family XrtA/PEP-CTERM system-associated protein [Gemmatimonadota bacterium]|nr:FemAB family XrtA/PEP-CTERM system-associated protein [Gemmatimonadota bacterium]
METCPLGTDSASSEDAWDRFVKSSSDGTPFHLTAWKEVVEGVFGHTPHYIVAREADEIRGILPLFEIYGLRSGHCLSSVPYGVYGGTCTTDPEGSAALLREAMRLGQRLRARYVELRQLHHPLPGLSTRHPFVTFTRLMSPDPEVNLMAIPRERRRMIRKGARFGLTARRGWGSLVDFHEIYSISRHNLGAPPFPLRMFEAIRDQFGSAAELLTIWHGGQLVAGVVSLFHQDRVMPYYGACLPEARALAANDFMYWELMRMSCLQGYRVFDFGQSHAGSGTYDFKRHWGFEPEPIAYQYLLVRTSEVPYRQVSPPRGNAAVRVWKRIPLPLTKRLGPALIRWLPLH